MEHGPSMTAEEKKNRIAQLRAELKKLQSVPRSDWHAGFEALLRIEIHKYGNQVRIETEHVLGEDPPRTDYLILREDEGLVMDKEIFKIFRAHNVIEYKNPHDSLNERVIRKICGYANFYIGLAEHEGDVPPAQVTISIFRAVKNPQLFREMLERGNLVQSSTAGIYYVTGLTDLPFQIVITGELEGTEYAAYRALTEHVDEKDVTEVIAEGGKETDNVLKEHYRVFLNLVAEKNPGVIEEIRRDVSMDSVLMHIMKDEVDKKVSEGKKEQEQETMLSAIRNVMEAFGVGAEKAMESLKIPKEQRTAYTVLMKNR